MSYEWVTYLASDGCWIKYAHLVDETRRKLCGGRPIKEGSRWQDGKHHDSCETCVELAAGYHEQEEVLHDEVDDRHFERGSVFRIARLGMVTLRYPFTTIEGVAGWYVQDYHLGYAVPVRLVELQAGAYLGPVDKVLPRNRKA